MAREGSIERKTRETQVKVRLRIDGQGRADLAGPIPALDRLLENVARTANFDVELKAEALAGADQTKCVEDIGLSLGSALAWGLGDRAPIARFGEATVPYDDALVQVSLDLSGRPYFAITGEAPAARCGAFDAELLGEFLRSLVTNGRLTAHVRIHAGTVFSHVIEACANAFGLALGQAVGVDRASEPSE